MIETRRPIAAATGVGVVHLGVTDGTRAETFYQEVLGLVPLESEDQLIHFGTSDTELVVLHPGSSRPVAPSTTGLYHFAIVVPSRRELARVVARLLGLRFPNSPTDHVLTKSTYLWDPDGNGIEVYAETPEDGTWVFEGGEYFAVDSQGTTRSGRDPINLEDLLGELAPDDQLDAPVPPGTKMGHVHLHVRELDEAVHFYSELIGFDVMGVSNRFGMAFVSAGGYHHHIGLNTWAGRGAPPPPDDAAGLRRFTIELPRNDDLVDVVKRLESGGVKVAESAVGFTVHDPSMNVVALTVQPPT